MIGRNLRLEILTLEDISLERNLRCLEENSVALCKYVTCLADLWYKHQTQIFHCYICKEHSKILLKEVISHILPS